MKDFKRAKSMKEEIIRHRRFFHENAEVGLRLPGTMEYVTKVLEEYGLQPRPCGAGVRAEVGREGRTLLLRADLDALPMEENSGEPFACPTGKQAHTCGHDLHGAMLLAAAKLLKQQEAELRGRVVFWFQPGEETFEGALDAVEHGILNQPHVDAAMTIHVSPGRVPVGTVLYNDESTMMASADEFILTVEGKGTHGAYPQMGTDPIYIGAQLATGLQGLVGRETDALNSCVISLGEFHSGDAPNIIPDRAILKGVIRTDEEKLRRNIIHRMEKWCDQMGKTWNGEVKTQWGSRVPALRCDKAFTKTMVGFIRKNFPDISLVPGVHSNASEDMAQIAQRIPVCYLYLCAGFEDERGDAPAHNPRVRFNEEVLPLGTALLTCCAREWLNSGTVKDSIL